MSTVLIRQALETALAAMSPALATAWENAQFVPVTGTPYQKVNILFATPDDNEIGPHHVEQGFMQVTLAYPTGAGPGAAQARAELIRAAFPRATTLVAGGIRVLIDKTPAIIPPQIDGDRYLQPVKIQFKSEF